MVTKKNKYTHIAQMILSSTVLHKLQYCLIY